jgi:hypothetical protein
VLLTGVRVTEMAGAELREFTHLDGDQATWSIPPARSKNGRAHVVPLSPTARAIVKELVDIANTQVEKLKKREVRAAAALHEDQAVNDAFKGRTLTDQQRLAIGVGSGALIGGGLGALATVARAADPTGAAAVLFTLIGAAMIGIGVGGALAGGVIAQVNIPSPLGQIKFVAPVCLLQTSLLIWPLEFICRPGEHRHFDNLAPARNPASAARGSSRLMPGLYDSVSALIRRGKL